MKTNLTFTLTANVETEAADSTPGSVSIRSSINITGIIIAV